MLTRNEVKARLRDLVAKEGLEDVRAVVDTFAQWPIRMRIETLLRTSTLQELQDILNEIAQEEDK